MNWQNRKNKKLWQKPIEGSHVGMMPADHEVQKQTFKLLYKLLYCYIATQYFQSVSSLSSAFTSHSPFRPHENYSRTVLSVQSSRSAAFMLITKVSSRGCSHATWTIAVATNQEWHSFCSGDTAITQGWPLDKGSAKTVHSLLLHSESFKSGGPSLGWK